MQSNLERADIEHYNQYLELAACDEKRDSGPLAARQYGMGKEWNS
jgi:hypothetical protein